MLGDVSKLYWCFHGPAEMSESVQDTMQDNTQLSQPCLRVIHSSQAC